MLRRHVRRQRTPATGSQRPAVPRLPVHGGRSGEPWGNGAHRVAGPDSVRLDGILHRVRSGAEPRFSKGAAVTEELTDVQMPRSLLGRLV